MLAHCKSHPREIIHHGHRAPQDPPEHEQRTGLVARGSISDLWPRQLRFMPGRRGFKDRGNKIKMSYAMINGFSQVNYDHN